MVDNNMSKIRHLCHRILCPKMLVHAPSANLSFLKKHLFKLFMVTYMVSLKQVTSTYFSWKFLFNLFSSHIIFSCICKKYCTENIISLSYNGYFFSFFHKFNMGGINTRSLSMNCPLESHLTPCISSFREISSLFLLVELCTQEYTLFSNFSTNNKSCILLKSSDYAKYSR